jgi:hypothetical protein
LPASWAHLSALAPRRAAPRSVPPAAAPSRSMSTS